MTRVDAEMKLPGILLAVCWSSALLAASDALPQIAPAGEDEGEKIYVELASLRFQKRNNRHGDDYRVCQMLLRCVFPGSGMLGMERADQDLTVTGSDGTELEITRTELSGFSVKDRPLVGVEGMVEVVLPASDTPRWFELKGNFIFPISEKLEILDFGTVELKESGSTVSMTDPVSVREGMGILDVVDVSKLGKVLMKVTRNKEDKVPHLDKVPGTNWRFMVYSNSIFHPRGFLFHDLDGKRITPRPTFQHMDHGGIGRSYLFDSSVKFVNVEVLYQGTVRWMTIPADLRVGIGGVMPDFPPAPADVAEAGRIAR